VDHTGTAEHTCYVGIAEAVEEIRAKQQLRKRNLTGQKQNVVRDIGGQSLRGVWQVAGQG
jgi:hypothetical protein